MKARVLRTLFFCCAAALTLTLATSVLTFGARAADIVDSGACGDNLTWTLDSDGVLTISGAGAMYRWGSLDNSPWYGKRDSIATVVMNRGVTTVGDWAFMGCDGLTGVTIPDSVTSIGEFAFDFCENLTGVTIPDSVTSIGYGAFWGCGNLTGVTIPDSVTSIGGGAFFLCERLTSVTIPAGVTSIGERAFSCCSGLTSVLVDSGNRNYMSENGVLFHVGQRNLLCCPAGKTGVYQIPDGVTVIGAAAFQGCANLTGVTIPDSVTSIGERAFYGCKSLTGVTIPGGVSSIGKEAFRGCANLKSVTISDGVTAVGDNAFMRCSSLTSVTMGDSVTSIGWGAFEDCGNLTSVTIPASVNSIRYHAFENCASLTDVYYGGSAAQWTEIRIGEFGNDALHSASVHYHAKDVGVGITLTDGDGNIIDANGQTGETEATKKDAFQAGDELSANFEAVDPDASSGLVSASVFIIFYDKNGLMSDLTQKEIDLSDPLNLLFILNIRIPEGAKTLKILMLGDGLEPLRAVRLIDSPDAA